MPRRYAWDQFEVLLKDNPNALNYPLCPERPHDQPLNETWFLEACADVEAKFTKAMDLSYQMLVKIVQLLSTCITVFQDIQHQRTDWYKYDEPYQGLAFDLNELPTEEQFWGFYARLQHLPNHFMQTWEEMMTTAFFDPAPLAFYATRLPLQTRFIAQRQIQRTATGIQSQLPADVSIHQQEMTLSVPVFGLKRDQLGDELGEEGGNDRRRSRGDPEGEATQRIKRQEKPVPERMRRSRETGP